MICARCGISTPRLTVEQTRCPRCQAEVTALIARDTDRRAREVLRPKVLTPFSGRPAA